uniref:hypothetical protein n=1 Tax=Acetatifactor sp. TaxID=1872090 RepID=UPI0040579DAF
MVCGSEEQYETVLKAKMDAVKQAGIPEAVEMLKMEERIVFLETQEKEINEAISVGENANTIVESILKNLSDAEGWGTWDLVGGGLIADLAKHEHLEIAQKQVEELQGILCQFKAELADVSISGNLQVSVDGFLKFADYFFDGLFADWAVMDRISESQKEVQNTQKQIEEVLNKLDSMLFAAKEEKNSKQEALRELALNIAL